MRNYVKDDNGIWTPIGYGTGDTTMPVAIGSPRQVAVGLLAHNGPAGYLRVTDEPSQLMNDEFDNTLPLDTVNKWNTPVASGGGVAAAVTDGMLGLETGTTANGYSYLTSRASIRSTTPGWVRYAYNIHLEDGAAPVANTYRFWGAGAPPATPTAAEPIANGAGFEVATDGKMYAVVYSDGVRTVVADLSSTGTNKQPMDTESHNYGVFLRPTKFYWYLDDQEVPVATSSLSTAVIHVETLPSLLLAVAGTSNPASSGLLHCSAMSIGDTAKGNVQLSDSQYPWRRATVDAVGALRTVPRTADLVLSSTGTGGQGVTLTLPATTGNQYHYITGLSITKYATATIGASSTPLTVSTTNMPGSFGFTFGTAQSNGTSEFRQQDFSLPLKSSAADTNTTIVCPATTNVIWRATATYFTGL